jgi:hypothetical protein
MVPWSRVAFPNRNPKADLYASQDGASFLKLSSITDADFSSGLCCGALYELPVRVGALSPGTLLWGFRRTEFGDRTHGA